MFSGGQAGTAPAPAPTIVSGRHARLTDVAAEFEGMGLELIATDLKTSQTVNGADRVTVVFFTADVADHDTVRRNAADLARVTARVLQLAGAVGAPAVQRIGTTSELVFMVSAADRSDTDERPSLTLVAEEQGPQAPRPATAEPAAAAIEAPPAEEPEADGGEVEPAPATPRRRASTAKARERSGETGRDVRPASTRQPARRRPELSAEPETAWEEDEEPRPARGRDRRYRDEAVPRQVVVYVPRALRDALRDHVAADPDGNSITWHVLNAYNTHYKKFGGWWSGPRAAEGPMAISTRRTRQLDDAANIWLYLEPAAEEQLDSDVARYNAGSRSALITRVLEEHLNVKSAPPRRRR